MDLPGENGGVTVVPSVYHNNIIECVHEPVKWVQSNYETNVTFSSYNDPGREGRGQRDVTPSFVFK